MLLLLFIVVVLVSAFYGFCSVWTSAVYHIFLNNYFPSTFHSLTWRCYRFHYFSSIHCQIEFYDNIISLHQYSTWTKERPEKFNCVDYTSLSLDVIFFTLLEYGQTAYITIDTLFLLLNFNLIKGMLFNMLNSIVDLANCIRCIKDVY